MQRPRDTSSAARAVQVAAFRAMSPAARVRRAIEMTEVARRIAQTASGRRPADGEIRRQSSNAVPPRPDGG